MGVHWGDSGPFCRRSFSFFFWEKRTAQNVSLMRVHWVDSAINENGVLHIQASFWVPRRCFEAVKVFLPDLLRDFWEVATVGFLLRSRVPRLKRLMALEVLHRIVLFQVA